MSVGVLKKMQEEIRENTQQASPSAERGNLEDLELAVEAGRILLENGAEISRVEETMERIARHFGIADAQFFVLSNGIFATGMQEGCQRTYAKVLHIPVCGARLDKVAAVNQFSREIEAGAYTAADAWQALQRIRQLPDRPRGQQILAAGIGSACFCYLFGGRGAECLASLAAGLLLYAFLCLTARRISKIMSNLCGAALAAFFCVACYACGFGETLGRMVVGAVIPLIPGVSFTNGIRDIADGDYLSGTIRLLDALLVYVCIAIGVGLAFWLGQRIFGGVL